MKPTLVILAAGIGSRYGGLKQLDSVGPKGETLLEYAIYDAIEAGFGKIVFVIRKALEQAFREKFSSLLLNKVEVKYVFQQANQPIEGIDRLPARVKPWGTAHAVLMAEKAVQEPFGVINADDYYGKSAYEMMAAFLRAECTPSLQALVGYPITHTLSDFGKVNRGVVTSDQEHYVQDIEECLDIVRTDYIISYQSADGTLRRLPSNAIVSMNFFGFHPSVFDRIRKQFIEFAQHNWGQPKAEFFIPLFADEQIRSRQSKIKVLRTDEQWYGVTYQEDKPAVVLALNKMTQLHDYPSPLWKKQAAMTEESQI